MNIRSLIEGLEDPERPNLQRRSFVKISLDLKLRSLKKDLMILLPRMLPTRKLQSVNFIAIDVTSLMILRKAFVTRKVLLLRSPKNNHRDISLNNMIL